MKPHPLQFVKDQWVWYAPPGSGLYSVNRITKVNGDFSLELQDTKKNVISVPYSVLEKNPNCVSPLKDPIDGSDPGKHTAKDLSTLNHASLADIECCIRNQFACGLLYTNIRNHVTLHINPNRKMDIYNEVFADRYSELDPNLPPHIYSLTALAYKSLCQEETSQVIVCIGDPGSGKSQAAAHALHFATQICATDEVFQKKCKLVPVILEAFLSAVLDAPDEETNIPGKERWPSSRALSSLELGFDEDGFIVSGGTTVQFYERSRVAAPANGRNFDAFYFYTALADPTDEWIGQEREIRIMPSCEHDLSRRDATKAQEFIDALAELAISAAEVFQALGAMLMLSMITFTEEGDEVVMEATEEKCGLLGTTVETLADAIVQDTAEESMVALDRLITDIYDILLSAVVHHINEQLAGEDEAGRTMTIIDIPSSASGKDLFLGTFDRFIFNWINDKVVSMQVDAMLQPRDGIVVNLDEFEPRRKARAALEDIGKYLNDMAHSMKKMGKKTGDHAMATVLASTPVSGSVSRNGSTLHIDHANGTSSYDIDEFFAYDARGKRSPPNAHDLVANSECEILTAGSALPTRTRGLKEAHACIAFLDDVFSKTLGDVRMVVNLRLNRTASKVHFDRDLMMEQLRNCGIEAVVNFNNAVRHLCTVKHLETFLSIYDPHGHSEGNLAQRAALVAQKYSWSRDVHIGESHLYGTEELEKHLSTEPLKRTLTSGEEMHARVSDAQQQATSSQGARGTADAQKSPSSGRPVLPEGFARTSRMSSPRHALPEGSDEEDVHGRPSSPVSALLAQCDEVVGQPRSPQAHSNVAKESEFPEIKGMHHLIGLTAKVEERLTKAIRYLNTISDRIEVKNELHELEALIYEKDTAVENKDYARIFSVLEKSEHHLEMLVNFQQGASQAGYLQGQVAPSPPCIASLPLGLLDRIRMPMKSLATSPTVHWRQGQPRAGQDISSPSHVFRDAYLDVPARPHRREGFVQVARSQGDPPPLNRLK